MNSITFKGIYGVPVHGKKQDFPNVQSANIYRENGKINMSYIDAGKDVQSVSLDAPGDKVEIGRVDGLTYLELEESKKPFAVNIDSSQTATFVVNENTKLFIKNSKNDQFSVRGKAFIKKAQRLLPQLLGPTGKAETTHITGKDIELTSIS